MPDSKQPRQTKPPGASEFQRLLDSSPAVHFIANATADYGVTYICKRIRAQLGYEPEHFTQDSGFWAKNIHPDDQSDVFANLEQLFENDRHTHEYRFRHADGSYCWMHAELALVRDKDRIPLNIIGSWVDIGGRKDAEDILRLSEARLMEAQRIARVGSWDWNIATNELWWSDEIYHMFGIEPHNFGATYEAFLERIHPEDRKLVDDAVERALKHREPYFIDHRIVTASGTERIVHEQAEVSLDAEGRPIRMAGTVHDITELKRAEARLTYYLEGAPDATLMLNSEGEILLANAQAERLFGFSKAEMLGKKIDILIPEEKRNAHSSLFVDYFEAPVVRAMGTGMEITALHKDGRIIPVEISLSPLETEGERLVSCSVRDIALRRRLQSQLQQAQKMEAVGELTGGVAHDFNNLLTVVLGNLELLGESLQDDENLWPLIEAALDAGSRGAYLTKRLLAFSRQQVLEPKTVNINELVTDVEPLLRQALGEEITIDLNLSNDLWLVDVDSTQLETTLLNLVVNARDAMSASGALTIETTNCDTEVFGVDGQGLSEQYVLLAVSDNGTGMPADIVERIFDPFFTTKDTGKGSGLGLSMVHGFVKQSNGHIKVHSEQGRGTTFKIYFAKSSSSVRQTQDDSSRLLGTLAGDETVLVVEDDPAVRQVAVTLLQGLGYTILEAENAAEALVMVDENRNIDLMFTDIVLPGGVNGMVTWSNRFVQLS